jgi:hypothetical protein
VINIETDGPRPLFARLAFLVRRSWLAPRSWVSVSLWFGGLHRRRRKARSCRDGTLVLRREDGEFRVVRPGAELSWRAAS